MTIQYRDIVKYRGAHWDLLSCSAGIPFDPEALGFKTFSTCSACWRGYVACYKIKKSFSLSSLEINLKPFDLRLLRWRPPLPNLKSFLPNAIPLMWLYLCRFRVDYSGKLLIGRGEIRREDVSSAATVPFELLYEECREFVLSKGRVTEVVDRSDEARALREAYQDIEGDLLQRMSIEQILAIHQADFDILSGSYLADVIPDRVAGALETLEFLKKASSDENPLSSPP